MDQYVADAQKAGTTKTVAELTHKMESLLDRLRRHELQPNAAMVDEFKAGKEKAFNALVGQAMKASKGKANPAQVNDILKKKLQA